MEANNNNKEVYALETADNLIRWDKFHFVNEDWGSTLKRENVQGTSENIVLPASDLYLIAITEDDDFPGMLKMLAMVDPLDDSIPHKLVTGLMNIHPKEPLLLKQRNKYSEGPLEVIKLVNRKYKEASTEKQRLEMLDLKKKVSEFIAKESLNDDENDID